MNKKFTAQIGLLFVTIIWGLTFVIVKDALNDALPFSFAALRFGLATILTLLIVNKKIFTLNKVELMGGILCGAFLFLGYAFQNFGLMITTATKSAFITSISVLLVPILLVALNLQKVRMRIWIAVLMATAGLYLLILPGVGINLGDIITFGCAISFAIHIIAQDYYIKRGIRLLPFINIQLAFVTVVSLINALVYEPDPIIWSERLFGAVIITSVLATFIAFLIMIWAQKILNPSETAIIFAIEPLAAALFAMVFAGELLGLWGWIGGSLICIAVAYGETGQT
jgi:drug/metabolite transporter (DMT)-like permease